MNGSRVQLIIAGTHTECNYPYSTGLHDADMRQLYFVFLTDDTGECGLPVYIPRADPHNGDRDVDSLHESLIMQRDVMGHKNTSTTDDHGLESVDLAGGKWIPGRTSGTKPPFV